MEDKQIIGLEGPKSSDEALALRKATLLRQGEFYRVGIVHAKAHLKQSSRPDALFHSAIDHATHAVRSRVDGLLRPTGINVASIMPYAMTILGFLNRRKLIKPALGILAAMGGAAYFIQQRRSRLVH